MDTVAESVRLAAHALLDYSESPRLDAELLLCKILDWPRSTLIVHGTEPLAADRRQAYDALLVRRMRGEPVAYLTGTREFWSLGLTVTSDVLVPRPETETLVERAISLLPVGRTTTVLDLGTGSGAIALAIASERPHAGVTAVDISARALDVARTNARALGLTHIDWRLGSWFDATPGQRFDVIVANPPYIAADDPALARLTAEPSLALTCGPTGLEALSEIIDRAALHLNPHGWLLLEHGSTQAEDVARLLDRSGFKDVSSHADFSNKPRITLGTVHSSRGLS